MNANDLTYLLNKPEAINDNQTVLLEAIIQQFPYFQSVRALYLKGLYNNQSFRYNYELKKAAAFTNDRSILFDFITSDEFNTLQKQQIEEQQSVIDTIEVIESEWIAPENISELQESLAAIKEEVPEEIPTAEEIPEISLEEKLDIGKPLQFNLGEKHSFNEWLQLTKVAPIERNESEKTPEIDEERTKKFDLIDKFIESNPKITPSKDSPSGLVNISKSLEEPTHLMTETLAQIYLEQKKYQRAIQAYEILILKYPEKSSFFADRINSIKKLQQNNNN
ncbi:tetratricopeptide repeat protein [Flavobacterium sp. U410]